MVGCFIFSFLQISCILCQITYDAATDGIMLHFLPVATFNSSFKWTLKILLVLHETLQCTVETSGLVQTVNLCLISLGRSFVFGIEAFYFSFIFFYF